MEYKDYYKIIGVEKNADAAEIKRAYRKLALKYHPDQNPDAPKAEENFKNINEAYQVLSDEEKRAHYDRLGSAYHDWERGGGRGGRGGFDWEQWGYGQQPGGVRVEYNDLNDLFGQMGMGGGVSDFFSQVFGGLGGTPSGGRGRTRMSSKPQTQEYEMLISLQEAYTGGSRRLRINEEEKTVKVPVGVKEGQKIRLRGAGAGGADIHLIVKIAPDPRFERKGNDLHQVVEIDLYTAVLGGKTNVATMEKPVQLKIPAGTQPGQRFRLNDKGMPLLKTPAEKGDLIVEIQIEIPKKLTDEEKILFEKLAKRNE